MKVRFHNKVNNKHKIILNRLKNECALRKEWGLTGWSNAMFLLNVRKWFSRKESPALTRLSNEGCSATREWLVWCEVVCQTNQGQIRNESWIRFTVLKLKVRRENLCESLHGWQNWDIPRISVLNMQLGLLVNKMCAVNLTGFSQAPSVRTPSHPSLMCL